MSLRPNKSLQSGATAAGFLAAVALIGLIYSFGWSGSFHFDDHVNLSGLSEVQSTGQIVPWLTSGIAGPTGRPVSLATFLIDGWNWPSSSRPFLITNTLLHLLNGLLVALIFLRLCRNGTEASATTNASVIVPLAAAVLWLSLPILASTNLIVVQRMALVAATFMLAGFLLYLVGREMMDRAPIRGAIIMWAGIIGGTVFGVLSKENAATLPLIVLAAEITLLSKSRPQAGLAWRTTFWLLLVLPSLLLLGYLASRIPGAVWSTRDFTLVERLSTQAVILWDYLRLALIPRSSEFSPFNDGYPVYGPPWANLISGIAVAGWILTIGAAIQYRRRVPLFSFAVFWYLGAHVIESSVIGLELYFEHRSYVPLIGPTFALVAGLARGAAYVKRPAAAAVGLGAFMIMQLLVLLQTTSLWGQPLLAAEIWSYSKPESIRATQYLAQQYQLQGDSATALRLIGRTATKNPSNANLALQVVQLKCRMGNAEDVERETETARQTIRSGTVDATAVGTIRELNRFAQADQCAGALDPDFARSFVLDALENARTQDNRGVMTDLYIVMAEVEIARRSLDGAMSSIESALNLEPDLRLIETGVSILNSAGLLNEALVFIDSRAEPPNRNIVLRALMHSNWSARIDELRESQLALIAEDTS